MSTADIEVYIDHLAPALPPEVFYSYVLPDMLSEHLHRFLLYSESPEWNPFSTLPLVSKHFHTSCRTLCINIFGLEEDDDGWVIKHILGVTKGLWDKANLPLSCAGPVCQYTYAQLMSSNSLIQVYMCAAIAKCYLNLDVLWNIDLEKRYNAGELDDVDGEIMAAHDNALGFNTTGYTSRRFKMRDDKMHRVYLPLTCALQLCDRVRPERVAYVMADYLAEILPMYTAAPLMLKYTQDLEMCVGREHRLELETWVDWARQTLRLIQDMGGLIGRMQSQGKLVKSFGCNCYVPLEVICATNVIQVLDGVAAADWGLDTENIHRIAMAARDGLLEHAYGEEEEEYD